MPEQAKQPEHAAASQPAQANGQTAQADTAPPAAGGAHNNSGEHTAAHDNSQTSQPATKHDAPPKQEPQTTRSTLPGYSLSINQGTRIKLILPISGSQFDATFIAHMDYQHVLLKAPATHAIKEAAQARALVRIRYTDDGSLFQFNTSIEAYIPRPVPMLAIAFPTNIIQISHRKDKRYSASVPARVIQGEKEIPCFLVNLSTSGCLLKMELQHADRYDPGAKTLVGITTTEFSDIVVEVETLYTEKDRYHVSFGCRFVNVDRQHAQEIERFVESIALLCKLDGC